MNTINESTAHCMIDCTTENNDNHSQKQKGLEIVFSMTLFVFSIFGIWQASSLAISIAALMQ